jgi:hypothetical protein
VQRHLRISKAVQISHLLDYILLPFLGKRVNRDLPESEKWDLKAIGGSGSYDWSVRN